MPRRKKTEPFSPFKVKSYLVKSGIPVIRTIRPRPWLAEARTDDLPTRIQILWEWLMAEKHFNFNKQSMLFFVMYDISNNRIRRNVAKYLEEKGCIRMQKSVFLGRADRKVYKEMSDALKEINEMYENEDSIVFLPIADDQIHAMLMIGANVSCSLMVQRKNVLIF